MTEGDRERHAPRAVAGPAACPARHCWVSAAGGAALDGATEPRPGLLLEWRVARVGWEGRVVYVERLRGASWALVEEWLPAALLRPL